MDLIGAWTPLNANAVGFVPTGCAVLSDDGPLTPFRIIPWSQSNFAGASSSSYCAVAPSPAKKPRVAVHLNEDIEMEPIEFLDQRYQRAVRTGIFDHFEDLQRWIEDHDLACDE